MLTTAGPRQRIYGDGRWAAHHVLCCQLGQLARLEEANDNFEPEQLSS